jgi:hypothetical protein
MMQTRKVVINTCFGGFNLSELALDILAEKKMVPTDQLNIWELDRDDYDLVSVVEVMGEKANTRHSQLKVVEIPADVAWQIEEYDGSEHIAEQHRIWC